VKCARSEVFDGDGVSVRCLLGFDAAQLYGRIPTFSRSSQPSSSG